ncbi:N,N-dimethylformamidase beta subunit family domain-containing protein [Acidimangrovimonas pyrenivorans]|uniref:N,N-dimethylformamidase beta subunit family domain-containing protein n=1 Tax=Acidimangrovimonas pyrenivorans TaxID=2030798 RepID=A0ABV7AEE3_9RHOB
MVNTHFKDVVGYTDPMSVEAGGTLKLKVSTTADRVRLGVRRVASGSWSAQAGPDVTLVHAEGFEDRVLDGTLHSVPLGSYAQAPVSEAFRRSEARSFGLLLMPTARHGRVQALVQFYGPHGRRLGGLALDAGGHLAIVGADGAPLLRSAAPLVRGQWASVGAGFSGTTGGVELAVAPLFGAATVSRGDVALDGLAAAETLTLGAAVAAGGAAQVADARFADPLLTTATAGEIATALASGTQGWRHLSRAHGAGAVLSRWDFSQAPERARVSDVGPGRCDAELVNTPSRVITGPFWDGSAFDWRLRPEHYNAVHFHADDLSDCGWPDAALLDIPADCPSGLYGAELKTEKGTDVVPFVVRARPAEREPVALLLPTFTYLSYGNAPPAMRGPDHGIAAYPDEAPIDGHPGFGRSHYDRHDDGAPVMLSSRLRPVTSMRFGSLPWGITPDTWLYTWLRDRFGQIDLLTDEDLHRDGLDALSGHRLVITGNHPEYYSTEMLDALEAFCDGGGRMMYLGGNGFYWRVSVSDTVPGQIEVRRTEDGTRAWIAEPGEGHHQMDGGYGGLWRRLGRPPNRLAGVGFAAQGFDASGHYHVRPDARSGPGGFALEGVGDDFGQHGWLGGGAAGQEIDRVEPRLAPDAEVHVLASSTGHPPSMLRTKEEMLSFVMPFDDPKARADVAIRFAGASGAVFSVGSMAWVGALLDGGDTAGRNDVARMTENVVRRFLDPAPFRPSGG